MAPQIIANRVHVPLRFVGEALGAHVDWEQASRVVRISSPRAQPEIPPPALPSGDPGPGPYDIIVVGGEPEGVAAAVAAARSGAKVLLVEKRDGLGGLMTYGMLNSIDMNHGPQGELLTRGVFSEFLAGVGGDSFDVEQARGVFTRLVVNEPNISLLLNAAFEGAFLNEKGDTITGVRVRRQGQVKTYHALRVIDATQDADVAAAAGVPYTVGAEDRGLKVSMTPTLVFHVGGVDWETMAKALKQDGDPGTGANHVSAWGFWPEMSQYRPQNPRTRVRALNIGKQNDGSVLINALQIFGVDGLDPASLAEAMEVARAEVPHIVDFMREKVPGFNRAYLVGTAPELYVRETRHIKGEYTLTINDVLENRDFPDRVAHGSYPVDIQATGTHDWGFAMGKPSRYSVPYRSLVPLKIENLLVVGRSASFTSLAAGSARVIPIGMATGQAAGVAAAYTIRQGITPRELAYRPAGTQEVQELLVQQGAYLEPFAIPNPLAGHWAYPYLRVLRPLGVVLGGYENDWRLDEVMPAESFVYLLSSTYERTAPGMVNKTALARMIDKKPLDKAGALRMLLTVRGVEEDSLSRDDQGLYGYFLDRGWLSPAVQALMAAEGPVTRGLAYALAVETFSQLGLLEPPGLEVGSEK
ncbi:hypothetical protein SY88_09285 [Clostridiales bacterium PH28_bin88]|nr:hypothetical protein SY88_09285 [Clostridiales bacterium PH28_bin88]